MLIVALLKGFFLWIIQEDVVQNADLIDQWRQKDVEARAFIYSTMKPEKQITLQGCVTAFEMWNRIVMEYAQVSVESEPLLWGQFYSYKFQPGTILFFSQ